MFKIKILPQYRTPVFLTLVALFSCLGAVHSQDPWLITQLPTARLDMAGAYANGKAVFAGGLTKYDPSAVYSNAADLYDVAKNTWTSAQLSAARSGIAAGVWGNKLIFAGGGSSGGFHDEVDIYDAATGAWTQRKLPAKRTEMGAATVDPRSWEAKNE
jgi:hypothetical protein